MSMEGSYTVEAACIMTCVFCVIACLIVMTCYIHDKAVAETICRKIAGMGIRQIQENTNLDTGELDLERLEQKNILWRIVGTFDDTKGSVIRKAEEELKEVLLIGKDPKINVELETNKIILEYQIKWEVPFGIWKNWMPEERGKIEGKIQIKEIESEELIRLCRGILQ